MAARSQSVARDEPTQVAAVRLLMEEGLGEDAISRRFKITRHQARKLVAQVMLERRASVPVVVLNDLLSYDAARAALAKCCRVDEVLQFKDQAEQMKLLARQAKDRDLMADAAELQLRATRQLGKLLTRARQAGQVAVGRPKNGANENPLSPEAASHLARVTLSAAGIDKKLADKARKAAAMPDDAFEAGVDDLRTRIIAGRALVVEAQASPIDGARSIMASRQEPNDSLDLFPTPPFTTRALAERVLPHLGIDPRVDRNVLGRVWEPACGEGHMSDVLREYADCVFASDIFRYRDGQAVQDFLDPNMAPPVIADWIITNPPFGDKIIPFVRRALDLACVGVAMFLRLQILETIERFNQIFSPRPPTLVAVFAERVPLRKGCWNPDGDTATAYCWVVWCPSHVDHGSGTKLRWIPPGCREMLSRPDDRARFAAWSLPAEEIGAPDAPCGQLSGTPVIGSDPRLECPT